MARSKTNDFGLAYTIESSLGVAGTEWRTLEPNAISAFGATITTVARAPISQSRQRRKGTTTDLDSSLEFEHDFTFEAFQDFIEGFLFSTAEHADMDLYFDFGNSEGVDGSDNEYDVDLTAGQAAHLIFSTGEYTTLIYARGFATAANNGLKALDADGAAATPDGLGVTDTGLVDETATATSRLQLAGMRFLDADAPDVAVAYSGTTLTITEQGNISGFDWTDWGLTVGQYIHVGSSADGTSIQNGLTDSGANDTYGYARITAISAQVLTCDKVSSTLQVASPTVQATLDILFGKFVRNVAVTNSAYLEQSYQFEGAFADLASAGNPEYQYSIGNYANTMAVNLPLTDKATIAFAFIGTDTEDPVVAGSRKSGASAAIAPEATGALNTSADIARLRITETDETGLTTDFKSATLTFNNNVTPEKLLGALGAQYMNTGIFEVNLEAQLLFSNGDVVDRIRANTTVTMDFILKNDDGEVIFDVPSLTLGDGSRDFPVNESILINVSGEAFEDATLGYSIGVSTIPVPLP